MADANRSRKGSFPKRSLAASTPFMKPGTRTVRPLGSASKPPNPAVTSMPGIVSGSVSAATVL